MKVPITKQTSAQKFFDLVETGFFYEFLNALKLAAILAHHSHQSPLCYKGVVAYVKEHVTLMRGKVHERFHRLEKKRATEMLEISITVL